MLLNFITENYLSFKERAELDLTASSSKKDADNVHVHKKYRILKSSAIYGANASGKSNFLKAISFMKSMVTKQINPNSDIDVDNFKLSSETENLASIFEVTFLIKDYDFNGKISDVVFRYGFELDRKKIHREWLFARFSSQESKLFTREGNLISNGEKFKEGSLVYKALGDINEKSLFLPLIFTLKGKNAPISDLTIKWFSKLNDITSIRDYNLNGITLSLLDKKIITKEALNEAFKLADLSIDGFSIEENEVDKSSEKQGGLFRRELNKLVNIKLNTSHPKYDENKNLVDNINFDFEKYESDGTKKFFAIIGPILHALKEGLILIQDEIDSKLHPSLAQAIISLFNSKANSKGAQLIFTTHNIDLMDLLRKEQIYFVDKNHYGESDLYSLDDFNVRNDVLFSKNYYLGKFGAVPAIGNLESLIVKDQ